MSGTFWSPWLRGVYKGGGAGPPRQILESRQGRSTCFGTLFDYSHQTLPSPLWSTLEEEAAMFSNGFFAFHPMSPPSHPRVMDDFPPFGRGPGDVIDKWMEILEPWSTGALVGEPSPWSRPPTRTRCCPHACLLDRPQPSPRQHFVILPSLLTAPSHNDREGGDLRGKKEAGCSQECMSSCRQNASVTGGSGEASCSRAAAGDSSGSKSFLESGKARGESPWQFSVDMSGCDEVRALTEKGMLMVEGRGSSDTSQQMVRYITSLPRHITHDSLTASLNNGRLTVTQKAGAQQLEGQARTLPIDVQQQQQQQQEGGESMGKEKQAGAGKEKSEATASKEQ